MRGSGLTAAVRRAGYARAVLAAGYSLTAGRSLARWVREARTAGLDDESIESLLRVTLRADPAVRDSDSEEIA